MNESDQNDPAPLTLLGWYYIIAGTLILANGLWMVVSSVSWYNYIPAGVPDTGPLNSHLVRDLGIAFSVMGLGLFYCARRPEFARPIHSGIALFFFLHAILHVVEIITGQLPHSHWWLDMPLTFLPAVLLPATLAAPVRRLLGEKS